jgi:hypothetical protein
MGYHATIFRNLCYRFCYVHGPFVIMFIMIKGKGVPAMARFYFMSVKNGIN